MKCAPDAFSDPISAITYSDMYGPSAQLEMILISEDARLKTALTRLSDLASQVAEAAAHSPYSRTKLKMPCWSSERKRT